MYSGVNAEWACVGDVKINVVQLQLIYLVYYLLYYLQSKMQKLNIQYLKN